MASAQPKIQKMCEEESDDTEAVAKLFEINDSIHRTLQRYKLTKKGDLAAAAQIPKGTLGTSGAGVRKGPDNELSLIDFGSEEPVGTEAAAEQGSQKAPAASLEDDLLGLSVNEGSSGQISLAGAGNCKSILVTLCDTLLMVSVFSMQPAQQIPSSQPPNKFPSNGIIGTSSKPNYDIFHNLDLVQQTPAASHQPVAAAQQRGPPAKPVNDPFAALSSLAPRQASPFPQYQQSTLPPPSRASIDKGPLAQFGQTSRSSPLSSTRNSALFGEDEWTFSSSLPDQSAHEIILVNSSVNILFHVSKAREADGAMKVKASVSNNTTSPIADFTLQLAVMKVCFQMFSLSPVSFAQLSPPKKRLAPH